MLYISQLIKLKNMWHTLYFDTKAELLKWLEDNTFYKAKIEQYRDENMKIFYTLEIKYIKDTRVIF